MPWYYEVNREQRGPVADDEFARLVQSGVVRAETLVWREGWANWQPYSQSGSAFPAAMPTTAPTFAGVADDAESAVCAVSGQRRPKRDMLQFEGRWVSAEHKEEFFQRLREGVAQQGEMVYAGFWIRFGAKFIDGIILGVANAILGGVIGGVMGAMLAARMQDPETAVGVVLAIQAVSYLVGTLMAIAYALFFIRKWDATPGKRMLGLKVLRADGSSLSKGRIVGRYFAEFVSSLTLLIGYLMAAFDKEERRALHDRMCDTRVVKVN